MAVAIGNSLLSGAVGGAPDTGLGKNNVLQQDVTPPIKQLDVMGQLKQILNNGPLALKNISSSLDEATKMGALNAPVVTPSSATGSPGMGTYGNTLPSGGNQGNPSGTTTQQAQAIGRALVAKYGWDTANEWTALNNVAMRESGWNPNAVNAKSGAYGIGQSLGHGHPYNLGDAQAQIQWMLNYIKQRYGDPAAAWQHELSQGWY